MAVFLPDELDCHYCTDQQKDIRGCEKDSVTGYVMGDGEIVYRCPVKSLTRDTASYLQIYNHCDKYGKLPFNGSLAAQPAKVMQVFAFIQNLINRKSKEQMEKIRNAKHRP